MVFLSWRGVQRQLTAQPELVEGSNSVSSATELNALSVVQAAEERPVTVTLDGETLSRAAAERIRYAQLQRELLLLALAATVVVGGLLALLYDGEVAVSYAVGSLGGVMYLRLLNKTCAVAVLVVHVPQHVACRAGLTASMSRVSQLVAWSASHVC